MRQWTVRLTRKANQELEYLLKKGEISKADIRVLLAWIEQMEELGPEFIAMPPEWHDHELLRDWIGFRSSAFSKTGRIIYRILENQIIVKVYKITSDHNYKK